jgi:hypothetical protein
MEAWKQFQRDATCQSSKGIRAEAEQEKAGIALF